MRLLTHVLCKPTHFFFHSLIATISYSLQTSFSSVMKDWADKYHEWSSPTRSPLRSNTSITTLFSVLSCARPLRKSTSKLNRCLWPPCHSDMGDRGMAGGLLEEQPVTLIDVPTPLASSGPPSSPVQASLPTRVPLKWNSLFRSYRRKMPRDAQNRW